MIRKLMVILLTGGLCLSRITPALAQERYAKPYATLTEYERFTGNKIEKFNEAPILRARVAAGELPPVEERLPEEPIVIEPLEEIGQYGGTLITASTALERSYDSWWAIQYYLANTIGPKRELFPHVLKGWDLSEDFKTIILHLRKGMKWSDGVPYTADDIMFWYEDILLNDNLTPVKPEKWSPGGKLMEVEKIDDYTVRLKFAVPYPVADMKLIDRPPANRPKHYLKKWHIKYNPRANELAKEEGYDNWWQCFNFHANAKWRQDVNLPVNFPWILKKISTTKRIYERNPYYWMVDTAGNQLPYADKMVVEIVANAEVYNLKAISGELSYAGYELTLDNYPLYKKNEERGDYEVRLWDNAVSTQVGFAFNLTHKDPVLRKIFNDIRFRQAMSLAIDRDEINDLLYFGKAVPRQPAALPTVSFYEPWMGDYYTEYNPERANALLDEMGLDKKNKEGYRLRPDGKPLVINVLRISGRGPQAKIMELVKGYWKKVGVKVNVKEVKAEFYATQVWSNSLDVGLEVSSRGSETAMRMELNDYQPPWGWYGSGVPWEIWHDTHGKEGEEPPEEIKRLFELCDEFSTTPVGTEKYMRLGKEILTINVKNLFVIGTVGLAPKVIIVKKNLKNVPRKAPFDSLCKWWAWITPHWFFEK